MTVTDPTVRSALAEQEETRAQLVQTAHELIPLLRRNGEQSERDRRLVDESAAAMRSAGLLQACGPRRAGGSGGNAQTLIEVVAELCRGDGSAGWVAMIANMTAWTMGLFPDDARDAVYGDDPHTVSISQFGAGGTGVPTKDGYRITGQWPFASGCHQAQWTISGFLVVDGAGKPQEIRWALMPIAEMEIKDSWFVAGMAGTGSNTLVANDLVVPAHWTIDADTFLGRTFPRRHSDEAAYRSSVSAIACLGLGGPLLGMAEAVWDITMEVMNGGRAIQNWNYDDARESPGWRSALAEARAAIDTGRLHLLRGAQDLDRAAQEDRVLSLDERARLKSDQAVSTTNFRTAVDLLLDINGTRSFALSNPLQRFWRDFGTASRHGLNNGPLNREAYALSLTGLDMDRYALFL
ncbi:acyl-CoA dehydrogenase family protein [Streptomyces sp. NPDC005799]|uniref:acyl-CoA dehydrogenase family protein n=1 Tax=Streptomyces sp. NPDC005799 TaxID=3154678 RepID=UPI0033F71647